MYDLLGVKPRTSGCFVLGKVEASGLSRKSLWRKLDVAAKKGGLIRNL